MPPDAAVRDDAPPAPATGDRDGGPTEAATTLCRSARRVAWRRRPRDEAELRAWVVDAGRAGQPLHVVSTGRNWGYGSSLPARDGGAIVDLSGWTKIGPLDRGSLSVRIEPGVTQGALHDWLRREAPDLAFNITGAGTATSVLGCALERGQGYMGPLERDVFGLEVMLADGSVVRPPEGWFHPARDSAAGPAFDALFFQSNYGIVLAARLRLRVRQECEQAVLLTGTLPDLLATLGDAYREGVITLPTHIAEPGRTGRLAAHRLRELRGRDVTPDEVRAVFPERDEHVALTALHGRKRVVDACWAELKRAGRGRVAARRLDAAGADRLERLGRLVGLRNLADRLAAFRPLLGLTWGDPTDVGLQALPLPPGPPDPDRAAEGAIYGNAVSALEPAAAAAVAELVRAAWPTAACTFILTGPACLVTVYTLHFDAARTAEAKAAEAALAVRLRAAGFPPYRLGINLPGPAAGGLHARLKAALDPAGILAPGRYEAR